MFARKGIEVAVASRRSPRRWRRRRAQSARRSFLSRWRKPLKLTSFFWRSRSGSTGRSQRGRASWQGKTVIDVTNAYGVPVEDLGGLPSSAVIARTLPGARLVKAFNHLPAAALAADPAIGGGRRVIFVSSDDDAAATPVRSLAEQLGFAPVWLGKLAEAGSLVQARDKSWAPLIFQDLFKKGA
ncbi:hypothetical protein DdX_22024 [Ditylenchus destructor]|uniref:Uncharacterized protein n=1 Tax=Ditylenchus destructor TaxID=166010 RepID=A0AAD4QSR1_9BILA|nr:hypothetical protein DdX_22024 [Ditylenchus destructor]